jgi:ABC-type sugar transport system substrate-binding protein
MKSLLSVLVLSVAAMGAAQAGELGYPPAPQSAGALSHQQVQNELVQARAQGITGNGELVNVANTPAPATTQLSRSQVQQELNVARSQHTLSGNGELDSPVFAG